jgi:serine/threonine protein kinase
LPVLLTKPIDWELNRQQYEQMVKYATALRLGTAETEAILRRFTRNNTQHPTYKALSELGKAIKTIFLCRYLHTEALRREIHEGLNVIEQWNGANDFVFFARRRELASNRREDHEVSMLALHLLQNCMVYINTLMLQKVLAQLHWSGKLGARDLSALTPLIWEHVNPYGRFDLDISNAASRFKREIHLARKVTHPNVCRIFDLFRHAPSQGGEETLFVSMELLHGTTLAEKLEVTGSIPMQEALPLVTQMASALSAAHDVGIVHLDFKPSNVVQVSPTGERDNVRVVVTDLGLASRSLSAAADSSATTLTMARDLAGTPAYMAPEQIEGHPATAASDIYALGLVIYEMVTGQRPIPG